MPPNRKPRGGGTAKCGTSKTPPKVKAASRVTGARKKGNHATVTPRGRGQPRPQRVTREQVVEALGGLDPPMNSSVTADSLRALAIDVDATDPSRNAGVTAPRTGNQEEVLRLQAQVQRLGSELSHLRERQNIMRYSSTPSSLSPGTGNRVLWSQGSSQGQGCPTPTVSIPQQSSYAASEQAIPMMPTPSEVSTMALMLQDQTPRGADAIPAFNNRSEDFETLILRLEAVASHYKWTDDQKRGLILSNLREEAATFIFKTLTERERQDYNLLIKSLTGRFTEIESRKVYRLRYRNLRQQPGESEQQLAARAKAIYDWACPGRDEKVRQEDLVNAFLEALQDDDQRRALEYPRVPDTIEEAALQAAHYREAARRPTPYVEDTYGYEHINRVAHSEPSDSYPDTAGNAMDIAKLGEHMIRRIAEEVSSRTEASPKTSATQESQPTAMPVGQGASVGENKVTLTLEELQKLLQSSAPTSNSNTSNGEQAGSWSTGGRSRNAHSGMKCDFCGKMGHTENKCWKKSSENRGPRRRDKSQIDCYICGTFGHYWYECEGEGALKALIGNKTHVPATVVKQLFAGWNQTSDANSQDSNGGNHVGIQNGVARPGTSGESQAK